MRIAVIGIGGLGGYYGGKLAQAYVPSREHEVFFVARGEHLAMIRDRGIIVRADDDNFTAFPTLATDRPGEIGPVDLVLFCVKSYDFEEAARGRERIPLYCHCRMELTKGAGWKKYWIKGWPWMAVFTWPFILRAPE